MDIDLSGEGRYASTRRLPYKYSIESWKRWAKNNNSEVIIMEDYQIVQMHID